MCLRRREVPVCLPRRDPPPRSSDAGAHTKCGKKEEPISWSHVVATQWKEWNTKKRGSHIHPPALARLRKFPPSPVCSARKWHPECDSRRWFYHVIFPARRRVSEMRGKKYKRLCLGDAPPIRGSIVNALRGRVNCFWTLIVVRGQLMQLRVSRAWEDGGEGEDTPRAHWHAFAITALF